MRIKNTIILSLALVTMLCLASCSVNHGEYYKKYLTYKDYFGSRVYSTIDYQCSEEERTEVSDVITLAEQVFSYVGTEENANKNVGALSKYYRYTDTFSFASADFKLDLITAKVNRNSGYMWVVYSVDRYNSNGNIVSGSSDIPCYWKIEKKDDQWTVIDIIEPA